MCLNAASYNNFLTDPTAHFSLTLLRCRDFLPPHTKDISVDTSVSKSTGFKLLDRDRIPGSDIYLPFATASTSILGLTQPPVQLVLSINDHSPPSSAEFKNARIYISTPLFVFMTWWLITRTSLIFCEVNGNTDCVGDEIIRRHLQSSPSETYPVDVLKNFSKTG
jgi:hypothetical protein